MAKYTVQAEVIATATMDRTLEKTIEHFRAVVQVLRDGVPVGDPIMRNFGTTKSNAEIRLVLMSCIRETILADVENVVQADLNDRAETIESILNTWELTV